MKKIITLFIFTIVFIISSCSSDSESGSDIESFPNPPLSGETNTLVVYFSWSSDENTKTMAEYISEASSGELFRIYPEVAYTTNYNEVIQVAQEERNQNARPVLAEDIDEEIFSNYDVVFLGYPIWWYDAPMIIYTFLESHDFRGKTIIPFATSGGSSINEESKFKEITNATVLDGFCIPHFSKGDSTKSRVIEWVEDLGYNNNQQESQKDNMSIKMSFNNQDVIVELTDNSATRDLIIRLSNGPIELVFQDYAGSEKIAYPNPPLDLSDTEGHDPEVGDLMIYKPWNNLCAFYIDSSGYSNSLTLIGHIQNNGIQMLAEQTGDFVVTLSLI